MHVLVNVQYDPKMNLINTCSELVIFNHSHLPKKQKHIENKCILYKHIHKK